MSRWERRSSYERHGGRESPQDQAEVTPFCTCAFGIPVERSPMTKKERKKKLDGAENASFLAKPTPVFGMSTPADKEEVSQGICTGS